jgi:hypothetical protein
MHKKILTVLLVGVLALSLAGTPGCSLVTKTTSASAATIKTIREAKIGSEWSVKQMEITLGKELPIVLKLATGDDVEGYFYLEKGDDVDFTISGKSTIYESTASSTTNRLSSDRFTFSATASQGVAYTLTLSNPTADSDSPTKLTIFIEIVYPATGSVYIPIETE